MNPVSTLVPTETAVNLSQSETPTKTKANTTTSKPNRTMKSTSPVILFATIFGSNAITAAAQQLRGASVAAATATEDIGTTGSTVLQQRELQTTTCQDFPNWSFSFDSSFDCDYFKYNPSDCEAYGDGGDTGKFKSADGKTANQACCACNGGTQVTTDTPPTETDYQCPTATQETEGMEEDVLRLVNKLRETGVKCHEGEQPPAQPLVMDSSLRCAARFHSQWQDDNLTEGKLSHGSPDGALGNDHGQRARNAGFQGSVYGENIAYSGDADWAVKLWLDSKDGHCKKMMEPNANFAGVGKHGSYWTLLVGEE